MDASVRYLTWSLPAQRLDLITGHKGGSCKTYLQFQINCLPPFNPKLKPLPNYFDLCWCQWSSNSSCCKASFILLNKSVEAQFLSHLVILHLLPEMAPSVGRLLVIPWNKTRGQFHRFCVDSFWCFLWQQHLAKMCQNMVLVQKL